MKSDRGSIAIIGAGLGGLTAALALMRAGWRVRVFDQAPVLGEVGAGITLSPGAGRGLASLGLEDELLATSAPIPNIAFVHFRTGELLAGEFDEGKSPDHGMAQPRHIHRADLHAILLAAVLALDTASVITDKRLLAVEQTGHSVAARFADGSIAAADILVGADGARSVVRRQVMDDTPPEFASQVAFRCLIPWQHAASFMHRANAMVFIGAARIFNRYVIRRGTLVNVVGIAKSDRWHQEGWRTPATTDEFLAEFDGFHGDVTGLIRRAPADHLIKWGLFVRPAIPTWHAGRVILLGDAAHPILPFLGLGAALAIEDGVVLARALSLADDFTRGFEAFQHTRADRVETVRVQSILQGEIIQASDPDRTSVTQSPSQRPNLFDYDPSTVPIHV